MAHTHHTVIKGEVELLMGGLHLAGPNLTPDTFRKPPRGELFGMPRMCRCAHCECNA
jgi:hypothetical protein